MQNNKICLQTLLVAPVPLFRKPLTPSAGAYIPRSLSELHRAGTIAIVRGPYDPNVVAVQAHRDKTRKSIYYIPLQLEQNSTSWNTNITTVNMA